MESRVKPTESVTSMRRDLTDTPAVRVLICMAAVIAVIVVLFIVPVPPDRWLAAGLNLFLVAVLVVSIRWGTRYAILVSVLSTLAYSVSMAPAGHLHYDARVLTLFTACLVTGVVAGQLSARVRDAMREANQRRGEAEAEQRRFTALVNSVEGIVWEADAVSLAFSFVSDQAARVLGYPTEKWLQEPTFWKDHLHPDDRDGAVQFCAKARNDKRSYDLEYRMIAADGRVVWMRDLVTVVVDNGRATRLRGVMIDITRRKRVEQALRESERSLAEAQKLTHTGSFIWDVTSRQALNLSDEWYRIYGFDKEKKPPEFGLQGDVDLLLPTAAFERRAWEERLRRIYPEDRARLDEAVDQAIREKSDYEQEYRIVLPDGATRYLHVLAHPVLDGAGDVVQFMGGVTDVTERRQAEEGREKLRHLEAELARINRVTTMGELTASLAHEINQPIAAAVTNANTAVRWLNNEVPNIDEARNAANRAAKDATRAAEIINRIRAVYRKEATQRELVDVNQVIDEMMQLFLRTEANRHNVSIRSELAGGLPRIRADRVQLQQVVLNLMINGIDAMMTVDGARVLTLSSQRDGGSRLVVSVSDTGVGLPPDTEKLFEAFFTTKPHGTGMGLAISRGIVESHGGRLWATPNPTGGSTFHFTLPTT